MGQPAHAHRRVIGVCTSIGAIGVACTRHSTHAGYYAGRPRVVDAAVASLNSRRVRALKLTSAGPASICLGVDLGRVGR